MLVAKHQAPLLWTARSFVRDIEAAREVVQETWLGFLNSLDRFEARCSIKTWLFRILVNKARTRGLRDHRCVPFSQLIRTENGGNEPVDPGWFTDTEDPSGAGHWAQGAARTSPERIAMDGETMRVVRAAVDALPKAQGIVMFLRDIQGLTAKEVCVALGITPGNQRVLLHRARTRTRAAISSILERTV